MDSLASNPTLQTVYMVLISVAMINYGFMAFQRNPLEQLVSKAGGKGKMIIFGILGLIGVHYMLNSFGWLDETGSYLQKGYQRGREIMEFDENFRHRRRN